LFVVSGLMMTALDVLSVLNDQHAMVIVRDVMANDHSAVSVLRNAMVTAQLVTQIDHDVMATVHSAAIRATNRVATQTGQTATQRLERTANRVPIRIRWQAILRLCQTLRRNHS
jgi:hypothetical protein